MVIDSSIVVAILFREPDRLRYERALGDTTVRLLSAATLVELMIVMERRTGAAVSPSLDTLLEKATVEIIPFDHTQALIARDAFRRFGKGRHPAGLNLGDCFSYALAKHRDEPLLFKGSDFSQTDITPAI